MKNARTDWASYRSRLTDKLTGLLSAGKKESVMIVGAGRCNDIDLVRLGEAAEKIILADVDDEGMKAAISKMPAEKQMKVQCKVMSLTGIGSEDTEAFCEEILYYARKNAGSLSKEAFRDHLMSELEKLLKISERTEEELLCLMPGKSADIVVCCGVCSQHFTGLSFFIRSLLYSFIQP